jgi:hypothetical protein
MEELIHSLQLQPHPEGGFYRETYRASEKIKGAHLPARFGGDRAFSTAIYFLLRSQDRSVFHRIQSDEVWHYYAGGTLSIYVLQQGELQVHRLGTHPSRGESFQVVVPAGCWFGARVEEPGSFVLAGCTVAPGFDFADFEMADREELLRAFPAHRAIIEQLT